MTYAQKVYFIYLQTEPVQAFYVKLNGKLYSSSASGYLILPRLVDSTYSFSIGFNQQGQTEHSFTVKTEQKDHGFLVKDFGEKGWGIVDLQTLSIQYPASPIKNTIAQTSGSGNDVSPFTDLLSKATGDPSLRETPPAPKAVIKPVSKPDIAVIEQSKTQSPGLVPVSDSAASTSTSVAIVTPVMTEKKEEVAPVKIDATPVKAEPVEVKKEDKQAGGVPGAPEVAIKPQAPVDTLVRLPVTIEEKKELTPVQEKEVVSELPSAKPAVITPAVVAKSVVTKRSESSTTEGFGLVFIDSWDGGKSDTIRLLIPNPKRVAELVKETPKPDKKFLDIQATVVKPEEKKIVADEKPVQPVQQLESAGKTETKPDIAPQEKPVQSGTCAATATESDFFALRKLMAAAEGDDEMISLARKNFKQKCFTSGQLKNLSTLFLNDEAKYNFFDAAYKYTSDKAAFASLEAELKDPYYINRFRAMIQ